MRGSIFLRVLLLFGLVSVLVSVLSHACEEKSLSQDMHVMDAMLFGAFNQNDIDVIKEVFHKDLDFYHDKSGIQLNVSN